ncbi:MULTISPECIES: hypothetical protein [Actinoplanes]|uniref:hypothetical protein n=1 Tax=Actinoplanes TaxID=1865 RepID=UPI000B1CD5D3|nr:MULTISPECIES: hypothetical protein [Actinoplanes]
MSKQHGRRLAGLVAAVLPLTLSAGTLPASAQPAPPGRYVCYEAHVQNVGWQGRQCNGGVAGTTGQSLRLEAITITGGGVGALCYEAHVQNVGWQSRRCNGEVAGTTGQSLRLEALTITASRGSVCYNAHVQNIGWQGWRCDGETAGTTGRSLRLEAIMIKVSPGRLGSVTPGR